MRVISGKFKKKKLLLPDPIITRPLRDYIKESIFNLLTHSKILNFEFKNSKILDVFSGSGSFGIECISRGSSKVIFLEKEKKIINILNKNIQSLLIENQSSIHLADILKFSVNNIFQEKLDLIFLDPPFKYKYLNELFTILKKHNTQINQSLILIHYESNNNFNFDNFFDVLIKKNYGRSAVIFGKVKS